MGIAGNASFTIREETKITRPTIDILIALQNEGKKHVQKRKQNDLEKFLPHVGSLQNSTGTQRKAGGKLFGSPCSDDV